MKRCSVLLAGLSLGLVQPAPPAAAQDASLGHASGPGYEPYEACPVGLTPVAGLPGGETSPSASGELCADLSKPERVCSGSDGGCTTTYPTTPRQRRSEPYYVDISSANGVQRFYFSLQGY